MFHSSVVLSFFFMLQSIAFAASPVILKKEVSAYRDQVEACIHFSGEPSDDPVRAAQLKREIKKFCPGIPQEGKRLREKYKNDPRTIEDLDRIAAEYRAAFGE
ncbi:MAG TPA: hypothetical protein DF383_01735 [Deltaproteobacteria bacterium]|nr:hypothetical protein [Deltaproteobacteria bacterium]